MLFRSNQELFRELGVRLELMPSGVSDALGEPGAFMEMTAQLPAHLGDALRNGELAPAPGVGNPIQFVDIMPKTADQRAHLFPADVVATAGLYVYQPDPSTERHPLSLISPANEHTVSSTLGELRPNMARVRMSPDDAHARNIADGDEVRVFNDLGEVQCEAAVTGEVRPGIVALSKGLWSKSTINGATSNALVPDSLTDIGGGACFNDARVQIELLARH